MKEKVTGVLSLEGNAITITTKKKIKNNVKAA